MDIPEPNELVPLGFRDCFDILSLRALAHLFDKLAREHRVVPIDLHERVFELLMDRDRKVRGQCPRGGRPDHKARLRARPIVLVNPERFIHRARIS